MIFQTVANAVLRKASPAVLKARKHGPEVGVGAGVIAMVAGGIFLARAHKAASVIHDSHKYDLEDHDTMLAEVEEETGIQFTPKQVIMARAPLYTRYAVDVAKAYGPPVLLTALGAGLIFGAHRVQAKRLQGLGAALVLVQQGFDQYRQRVVEAYGEEVDNQMLWGYETKEVTQTFVDADGKKRKKKVTVANLDSKLDPSMYNRIFGEGNQNWSPDPDITEVRLVSLETMANDRLHAKGWVSLNWVYALLGFEETSYGQVCGWTADGGDGYISFGLDNMLNIDKFARPNEWPLTFNVEGAIWDRI